MTEWLSTPFSGAEIALLAVIFVLMVLRRPE